jgi:hypothetical protein
VMAQSVSLPIRPVRSRMSMRVHWAAFVLLLVFPGCGDGEFLVLPEWNEERGVYVVEHALPNGLAHQLWISDTEVATGDTLRFTSFVTNRGSAPVELTLADCVLHVRTRLELDRGLICDGYSGAHTLEVGSWRRLRSSFIVRSGPGTYRVLVRHLLAPEFWLPFDLRVMPES